jgi:4-hydroxy-tetrahydrodipicolinate reductase
MRIALIGYGKMGHMVEEVALSRGHEITIRIDHDNQQDLAEGLSEIADVAIEFTSPDSAFNNVTKCIDLGVPVVSGSTGWNDKIEEAKKHCSQKNGAFLHTSNFSVGVNIFFEVNKKLASLMNAHPEYDVTIKEIHHTQKKDAPSGTAVTLAEQVISELKRKKKWTMEPSSGTDLHITSERIDPAPGTHYVKYSSPIDDIEIIHTAHNRQGFATGAVLAAEYIAGKKGVFTMSDVLGLG